jgi:hypothetical protein
MITLQEAYIKAKNVAKDYGLTLLTGCKDYGDVWGFEFMPATYNPKDSRTWIGGGGDTTVNKKTGEIGNYSPQDDFGELLGKAKTIPLKELKDWIQPVVKTTKKQNRVPAVAVAS